MSIAPIRFRIGPRTDARLLDHGTPGSGDTTAEKADLLERSLGVDSNDRHIRDNGVLREGRGTHLSVMRVSLVR